ncbi:DgyrCDS10288 [Dimorphilus gyrociliatus]|nr:DgyrCDS10288 [Dimorphilus gyrociliatus]
MRQTGEEHNEMPVDCGSPLKSNKGWARSTTSSLASSNTSDINAPMTEAEKERVEKYKEDLRRKRKQQEKHKEEEDFLRTSLRGSKRLQQLEETPVAAPVQAGIVNPVYEQSYDECVDSPISQHQVDTLKVRSEGVQLYEVPDIMASIATIRERLPAAHEELMKVLRLVSKDSFEKALKMHNSVVKSTLRNPPPVPESTCSLSELDDVLTCVSRSTNPFALELANILQSPKVISLLQAHDEMAKREAPKHQKRQLNKQQSPQNGEVRPESNDQVLEKVSRYGEDRIKIVRLHKTADPLGATVRNEGESVIIGRIVKGGVAYQSNLLHEGDEILEINGTDVRGKSVNEVCDLMANLHGTLTFIIVPSSRHNDGFMNDYGEEKEEKFMHVRAHFNYDPEDDLYIPCRELGLSFLKGDILHVIDQSDPHWWQAYREGEDDQSLAGLIPSHMFHTQRESLRQQTICKDEPRKDKLCARKAVKKKKKYQPNSGDGDSDEIPTYEEVVSYLQGDEKRPIVLIGPSHLGRYELRQRLILEGENGRFGIAIPHTSRPKTDNDKEGAEYHFVSKEAFEADLAANRFVEYGEYDNNTYGTTLNSIRKVIREGKICILNLFPQSLRMLRAPPDIRPYVIFIRPPNLVKLRAIVEKQTKSPEHTDDEKLKAMIDEAREMEENFGDLIDTFIVMNNMDSAYNELLKEINKLDTEAQWVPKHWVHSERDS